MGDTPGGRVVLCVVGTRPEVVKMAPVLLRLREEPALRVRLVVTGQHRELLDQALGEFNLVADRDLALMQPDQTLAESTARVLTIRPPSSPPRSPVTTVACRSGMSRRACGPGSRTGRFRRRRTG
jgi:hypothetical protein